MRVPREILEQIKERVRLSDLVGEYVRLQRDGSGGRSKGLCPFHSEKSPSFSVNDDRGFYYCFGCHASGDAFTFLVEHTGQSFSEAVRALALRTGVDLPEETAESDADAREKEGRELYFQVMGFAKEYFRTALDAPENAHALAYVRERGIDAATVERFQLGYAPDGWTYLVDAAASSGLRAPLLERAGLARRREERVYDAFRDRVIFPVLDLSGKPLAFSGRAMRADDPAKYINSPETKFYIKGNNLYGIHAARKAMRERDQAVVVEGNFDVVSLHAHGIDETVAPLGTALTSRQAEILRRFAKRVILAFDADRAGRAASRRAFEVLLEAGIDDVRMLQLEDGEDPDSFVRAHGGEALRERLERAPTMMSVVLDEALAPALREDDPVVRRQAMDAAAEWLHRVRDSFVQQEWREEVARRLSAAPALVRRAEEVARQHAARQFRAPEPEATPPQEEPIRLTAHEVALIRSIDHAPARLERLARQQLYRIVPTERFGFSLETLARSWSEGAIDWRMLIDGLEDRGVAHAILATLAGRSLEVATDDASFETLLRELQLRWVRARSRQLEADMTRLHREGDDEGVLRLLRELERLNRFAESSPVDSRKK